MSYVIDITENKVNNYHLFTTTHPLYTLLHNSLNLYTDKSWYKVAELISVGDLNELAKLKSATLAQELKGNLIENPNIPLITKVNVELYSTHNFKDIYEKSKEYKVNKVPEEVFPIAIRYITENGTYAVERPPFKTKINFELKGMKSFEGIEVWVPWTMTFIVPSYLSSSTILFGSKQLSEYKDQYIPSIFPNAFIDGKICFGSSLADPEYSGVYNGDIRKQHATVLNEYFSGGWNIDLTPNISSFPGLFNNRNLSGMLKKFMNMSSEDLHKFYPKIKKQTLDKIVNRFHHSYDRLNTFKYMFLVLGTFTLEETLDFYDELINLAGSNKAISFENLVNNQEITSIDWSNLSRKLIEQIPRINDDYNSRTVYMIFANHKDKYKDRFSVNIYSMMERCEEVFFKIVKTILPLKHDVNKVYLAIIDVNNPNDYTIQEIDSSDLEYEYSQVLIKNNCKPVDNNNLLLSEL